MNITLATWGKVIIFSSFVILLYLHFKVSNRVDYLNEEFRALQKAIHDKNDILERDVSSLSALSSHLSRQQQDLKSSYDAIVKDIGALKESAESLDHQLISNIQSLSAIVKSFPPNRNIPKEIDDLRNTIEEIKELLEEFSHPVKDVVEGDEDDEDEEDDENENAIPIHFEGAREIEKGDINYDEKTILIVTDKNGCQVITNECILIQNIWKNIHQQYSTTWKLAHLKLDNEDSKYSIPMNF